MRNAVFVFLYSLAAGILMALFIMSTGTGPTRYVFSLVAVLLGIRFFKRYETLGQRISFIVIAILFSLLLPLVYVALALTNGWYVNPEYLKGVPPQ